MMLYFATVKKEEYHSLAWEIQNLYTEMNGFLENSDLINKHTVYFRNLFGYKKNNLEKFILLGMQTNSTLSLKIEENFKHELGKIFDLIVSLISEEDLEEFDKLSKRQLMENHLGLVLTIQNYILPKVNTDLFITKNLYPPDEISSFIVKEFWKHRHKSY
jgi:hypothetical protein